jgi:trk system potassium uptake protein TrkA
MLDLKMKDIPETVARAMSAAGALGAEMLTVNASGGVEMMVRAQKAAADWHAKVLAVTVLTSLDERDLADIGQADVVVAMLRRDADNLAVALLARSAGVERVMVRMRDNAYRPVYAAAGIDRVLSETDLITGSVATAIEHDAIRHAMLLGNGSAIAFELTIPPGSAAAGKPIVEVAALPGFPATCVFAALCQADGSE